MRISRTLAVLIAVLVAALAPSAAAAQEDTGDIEITSAELVSEALAAETIVVKGTGRCAAAGPVLLRVVLRDLETRARGLGQAETRCLTPGERIKWSVQVTGSGFRPGDTVVVQAAANGAITDAEEKTLILKWQ
jgi:hypothetical protein